jgi:phosphoribosyl 1,2-cyclic phosphate phosphodiesterase
MVTGVTAIRTIPGTAACAHSGPHRAHQGNGARTTVAIDTGPDFREQMLLASVPIVSMAWSTRMRMPIISMASTTCARFVIGRDRLIDIHADGPTLERLKQGFGYCFETPPGSSYPPILQPHLIEHHRPFVVESEQGGALTFEPLPQVHGDIVSLAFRLGQFAYCPDVSAIFRTDGRPPEGSRGLLVIDALQYRTHPSHFSLGEALSNGSNGSRRSEPC